MEIETASHPISAVVAAVLVIRRGGQWVGPAFLGLLLGWGCLPLMWMLTREPRPALHRAGQGFNPSEQDPEGTDWDEWLNYYFNLRQDLVVQVILLLICLFYLVFVGFFVFAPQIPGGVILGFLHDQRLSAILWVLSVAWPTLAGCLLVSGYWLPWLGSVWRYADEIWLGSGLGCPPEVSWRRSDGPTMDLEDARLAFLQAVKRSGALHRLTLILWLLILSVVGFTVAREVVELRARIH